MREIKFRAWNAKMKSYADPYIVSIDGLGNVEIGGAEVNFIEIEMYTGLKDKNGVEIYEGDLLRVCKNKNGLLQVEFKNAYVGGWVLTHESTEKHLSLGARKQIDLEVIGNIHETI